MPKTSKPALSLNYDAAKSKGAGIDNLQFVLPATEAKDGKEHKAPFTGVTVTSLDQATALFNGDAKALLAGISDYVTSRNKRNAVTQCYQEAKGPEARVATSVLTLLGTGLPNAHAVAVQTIKSMIPTKPDGTAMDDAGAEAFINKVQKQRDDAARKREAAKAAKK